MHGRIWVVDWSGDQISALWLLLLGVPVSLDVTWKVSVSGVVNILKREVIVWLVELVQSVMVVLNVVLNTITIFVIDGSAISVFGILPFFVVEILETSLKSNQILRTVDIQLEKLELLLMISSTGHTNEGDNSKVLHDFYVF